MKSNKKKEKEVQDYVAKHHEEKRYTKKYSLTYQNWWSEKMVDLIKPEGKILDIGCGTGYFAGNFLKKYDVIGLDISEEMVKHAKKRIKKVIQGDAQNLPFENNVFDIIIARSLLHHLPDPEQGVKEIKRVLKNKGRVIFVDTLNSFLSNIPRRVMHKKSKHFSEEHKNFKEKELLELIGSELGIRKKYYFGYLAYTLLGFPDVLDIYKYIPFKSFFTPFLIKSDEIIAKIPLIKKRALGIMILAEKR